MLILLSPSKKLDESSDYMDVELTQPALIEDAEILSDLMKTKSEADISDLMGLSEKLSSLNYERYQSMSFPFTHTNARPALYTFKGDVYDKMDVADYKEDDLKFAGKHLRILSGLYGILKPMDLMQAYRLEMGTKLENSKGKNLYAYWENKITNEINATHAPFVLNLASNEYYSAVNEKSLNMPVVTIDFKQLKNGKLKTIGLMAKRARGLMADYIIKNKITDVAKLEAFDREGYIFQPDSSNDKKLTFVLDMDV